MAHQTQAGTQNILNAVLDSIPDRAVVVGLDGAINQVNHAWNEFGRQQGCTLTDHWAGVNYLDVCDSSADSGCSDSYLVASGIRSAFDGQSTFHHDYPCVTPAEELWFRIRVFPMRDTSDPYFMIVHQEITDSRREIHLLRALSQTDGLTGIGNRRNFDLRIDEEWRRDRRASLPLSLCLLDIDNFKLYNDHYGHVAGDEVLVKVAAVVQSCARRPGDLAARYGGEEFALVLGDTDSVAAVSVAKRILSGIRDLGIEHRRSVGGNKVSASIGVATEYPARGASKRNFLKLADKHLYRAKRSGGDQVCSETDQSLSS